MKDEDDVKIDEPLAEYLEALPDREFYDFVRKYGSDWIKETIMFEEGCTINEKPSPTCEKLDVVVLDLGSIAMTDQREANALLQYINSLDYYVVMGYNEKLLYKKQVETGPKLSYNALSTSEAKAKYEKEITDHQRATIQAESKSVKAFSERLAVLTALQNKVNYLIERFNSLFLVHSGAKAKDIITHFIHVNYNNAEELIEALCDQYPLFAIEYSREESNG